MKKILFSPVGSTDPIAGQHDGGILHILRHYDIDEIYMYYSKEMYDLEEKDNRYMYCLEKLQEFLGKKFKVHKIMRPELVDVHIFDYFLTEFREIIDRILLEEECELILNVSSGTPAMKSALQILGTTAEDGNIVTIQVSTPSRAYNKDREDVKGDYDVELQWEANLDNEGDTANRCSISSNINLAAELKKNLMKKQIEGYDYVAARNIALDMGDFLDENAKNLLEACVARLKLDSGSCANLAKKAGYHMLPYEAGNNCKIFEAFLLCKIKILREEYLDLLRSITPLFTAILERIIKEQLRIDIDRYYYKEKNKDGSLFVKWDIVKVKEDEDLFNVLTNHQKWELRSGTVDTEHLVKYIEKKSTDYVLINKLRAVRDIEFQIRNPVAHCLTFLTEAKLKTAFGLTPMDIFNRIKDIIPYTGIKLTTESLMSYDKANAEILKYL